MKKTDLSLWDTDLYGVYWSFFGDFLNNNIKNVSQIIDPLQREKIETLFMEPIELAEFNGFVNLINFIIYGIDLPSEIISVLNTSIKIDSTTGKCCLPEPIVLARLGFPEACRKIIANFFNDFIPEVPNHSLMSLLACIHNQNGNLRFGKNMNELLFKILNILIKAYEAYYLKEEETSKDKDIMNIKFLKYSLKKLIEKKKVLNNDIETLQAELNSIIKNGEQKHF